MAVSTALMDEITRAASEPRAQWRSRWGFLASAIGSAVGLGSIWRFAYVVYENGGGAYLIPYFVALATAGIPLMILEYGIGHKMRGSAPLSFAKVKRSWEWLGWWMVMFVMFGINAYYAVVIAWCASYLVFSFQLAWGSDPNAFFFQEFLGAGGESGWAGAIQSPILTALALVWFVNWSVTFFGIEKGVERANKIFMPLLLVLIVILVGWTWTLPGAAREGVARYLTPDFSRLAEPKVWIDAYSQIFFTLSLGFGIMVTYASYLPGDADLNVDAWVTNLVDTAISLLAGLAVFGTLGYMSAQTGKPFEQIVTHGIGLAFVAYPQAIALLPSFPELFGALFFLTLTVAGIASSISILEAFNAAVTDKFQIPRQTTVTMLSGLGFLTGIVFTTRNGLAWLDIVDHFLSHYGLFLACILQCVLVGWIAPIADLRDHVDRVSSVKIGRIFDFSIKYLIPGVLMVLLLNDLLADVRRPYGGYPWIMLLLVGAGWLAVTFVIALWIARRPWRRPPD
ncbi:MAG TPA: sodium-dependent transporter [Candidatus Binatia bacterium]|nr:sodium-dependent transporter [Candidatus Binatia bacterium]